MAFLDVMLDIETTGTDPVHTAILQIGAVAFDIETRTVNPDLFNRSLFVPPTRRWDERTREWWAKRPAGLLASIRSTAQEPALVMSELQAWALKYQHADSQGRPLRLWAKPICFDYPFIESYFKEFSLDNPFGFRAVVDLRTYLCTKLGTWDIGDWEKSHRSTAVMHNALNDALHQVKLAFEV
jgi:hypothetical protein